MPTSRNHRQQDRAEAVRRERARREQVRRREARTATAAEVPRGLTDENRADLSASIAAERAGDAVLASQLYARIPQFAGSHHGMRLATLAELGDAAPGWLYSRWLTLQAHRPGDGESGSADVSLGRALEVAHPYGPDPVKLGGLTPELVTASLFARDWILRQLLVYEDGGLRRLVEQHAGPALLARADRVEDWVRAPMGGYRLESDVDHCVQVVDLATRERIDVLDLGLLAEHWPGTHVIGRIVPIGPAPGRMFEWRPLPVDRLTAHRVALAHEPDGWVETVAEQARSGILLRGFSVLDETSMVTDLAQQCWLGLLEEHQIRELAGPGGAVDARDLARVALGNALDYAAKVGPALAVSRQVIAGLLLEPGLEAEARESFVEPAYGRSWRILAGIVPEPARSRCRALAERCEAPRAAAS